MATILLVEDGAIVSREVTRLLEAAGHRVVRCGGGPTPLAACLLLRHGRCALVDNADLLVFACALALPLSSRSYRGIHLLRAYRAHPDYGRLPLVLVAGAPPHNLAGTGPVEVVETHTDAAAVVAAVGRLLQPIEAGSGPTLADLGTWGVRRLGERDDHPQVVVEVLAQDGQQRLGLAGAVGHPFLEPASADSESPQVGVADRARRDPAT
jgi:CheY-like chemotaxis protein